MKKLDRKKLVLHTQVLRELSTQVLENAAAGVAAGAVQPKCTYVASTCTDAGELR